MDAAAGGEKATAARREEIFRATAQDNEREKRPFITSYMDGGLALSSFHNSDLSGMSSHLI